MRIFARTLAVMLLAGAALAGGYTPNEVNITGTDTAATPVTGTVSRVKGPLVQLHIILGTATNVDVDVTVEPSDSNEDSFTIYSADDVAADTVVYPVFDRHDSAGAALTSDEPAPRVILDPVQVVVSDFAQTGKTVTVRMIWLNK